MQYTRLYLLVMIFCLPLSAAAQEPLVITAVVDIDNIGFNRLQTLKNSDGINWWVELDDRLLINIDATGLSSIATQYPILREFPGVTTDQIVFRARPHHDDATPLNGQILAAGGRFTVIQFDNPPAAEQDLLPFQPNTVLASQFANQKDFQNKAVTKIDNAIQALVDQIDANRWFADVETLTGWNRWTHGTQIGFARDWLQSQFSDLGLTTTTMEFSVGDTTAYNVIATIPGTTSPERWLIVGAHYDSRAENNTLSSIAAPGAEDNASGCAAVLETARIFQKNPPPFTLLFICYSGEEQGLVGSNAHVASLINNGTINQLENVLIMDMIGYSADNDLDCLLESSASFQPLMDIFAAAATTYSSLRIVFSTNPFGSDHMPYIDNNISTLLVIENDWNQYPHYHKTTDTPDNINLNMGLEILKMNVAALAKLMGIKQADDVFSDQFEGL